MVSPQITQCITSAASATSSTRIHRSIGHSMRTIRSNFYDADRSCSFNSSPASSSSYSSIENLSDSVVDFHLHELAKDTLLSTSKHHLLPHHNAADLLDISREFCDLNNSFGSSDISGELERLALVVEPKEEEVDFACGGDAGKVVSSVEDDSKRQQKRFLSSEIEVTTVESVEPVVRSCVEILTEKNTCRAPSSSSSSASVELKRSAVERLRLLAKNRSDFRILIGSFPNAIPSLVPLLRSIDPSLQENAVTALLNLSLEECNKSSITKAGAIKPLIYVLKTGTATAKQNAACALLSLSMVEDNKSTIGSSGAIPPLVSLLIYGNSRGKKDAVTTLYKLCSVKQNKERAVRAGAVAPLVGMVVDNGDGMREKAMVVLNSLAGVREGREAIVDEGGIPVLVEALEDGSVKGAEFAVVTLLQLCEGGESGGRNGSYRALLVREGVIPPLVALSQSGSARAKQKVEALLTFLREQRQEGGLADLIASSRQENPA